MSSKINCFVFLNLVLIIAVHCRPGPARTLRNQRTTIHDDGRVYTFVKGVLMEVPENKSNVVKVTDELPPMKPIVLANVPDEEHSRRDPSRDMIQSDGIIFPDDLPPIIKQRPHTFVPRVQPNCFKTFCLEDAEYPSKYIDEVIHSRYGNFSDFLTSDVPGPINITQRIDTFEEKALCDSDEEFVFPQSGQNKENEWLFIINNQRYRQSVRAEICKNADGECNLASNFPFGYEATCKQKYIYRKLHAIDKVGVIIQDDFKVPSCCTCYYRSKNMSKSRK